MMYEGEAAPGQLCATQIATRYGPDSTGCVPPFARKRTSDISRSSIPASSGPRIRSTKATDDINDDYIVYLVARTSACKSGYQRRLIRSSQSLIALTTG